MTDWLYNSMQFGSAREHSRKSRHRKARRRLVARRAFAPGAVKMEYTAEDLAVLEGLPVVSRRPTGFIVTPEGLIATVPDEEDPPTS